MPVGIQVWDAAGNLVLDGTMRTGFILGSITFVSGVDQSGSLADNNILLGDPFYFFTHDASNQLHTPQVSFSGNDIIWTATTGTFDGALHYGIF